MKCARAAAQSMEGANDMAKGLQRPTPDAHKDLAKGLQRPTPDAHKGRHYISPDPPIPSPTRKQPLRGWVGGVLKCRDAPCGHPVRGHPAPCWPHTLVRGHPTPC